MSNPDIKIVDATTGNEIIREMTDEEFSSHQEFLTQMAEREEQAAAEEAAKQQAFNDAVAQAVAAILAAQNPTE